MISRFKGRLGSKLFQPTNNAVNLWFTAFSFSTEGGTRTHMRLPSPDFESGASANSATSASGLHVFGIRCPCKGSCWLYARKYLGLTDSLQAGWRSMIPLFCDPEKTADVHDLISFFANFFVLPRDLERPTFRTPQYQDAIEFAATILSISATMSAESSLAPAISWI